MPTITKPRLILYRLLRFRDFIFQLLGIIGVVVVVGVAGIWIAEVLRQLTSRPWHDKSLLKFLESPHISVTSLLLA